MSHQTNRRSGRRRGAVLVEAALTLPVFLLLLFGTIDLAVAVLHYNLVAEAARIGARTAIVHGADAAPEMASWDSASAAAEIREQVGPLLDSSLIAPDSLTVTVTYASDAEGNLLNERNHPVGVKITVVYVPMTPFLNTQSIVLSSSCEMMIAN